MIIKRAACLAFTAACLTGIATLPAAHAQTAYGTGPAAAQPTGDPGGNSVGVPGPNPGGPGLTPYSGGASTAEAILPEVASENAVARCNPPKGTPATRLKGE